MLLKKVKLRLGKGAHCRVLLPKIRPSQEIDKQFPNKKAKATLNDLIAIHCGTHKKHGDCFPVVWFTSATLPGIDLVVAKRFVHVIAEGPPDWFFEELALSPPSPGTVKGTVEEIVFQATRDYAKTSPQPGLLDSPLTMTTSLLQKTSLLSIYAMSLTPTLVSTKANHGVGMVFAIVEQSQ